MKGALVLLALLLAANAAFAQESKVLAVWPITDSSGKLRDRDLLAATNILRGLLARSAKFSVVDKSRQESKRLAVYKELKKESHEECYDQKCRIQLGQALSADNLLMCTIEALGTTCTLTCELVPLEREVAEFAAVAKFKCGAEELGPAVENVAAQLTGKTQVAVEPVPPRPEPYKPEDNDALVKFEILPAGAWVKVDGNQVCQATPCSRLLTRGRHALSAGHAEAYPESWQENIDAEKTVSKVLRTMEGAIKVVPVDHKGDVLDGTISGTRTDGLSFGPDKAPGTVTVRVGTWSLTVSTDKGQWTGNATVKERKTVRITPEFKGAVKSKYGIEMALIKAGTFMMGSPTSEPGRDNDEGPQHRVTISRDFHLSKTEVTQGQWKKVMGNNPSSFSSCGEQCPVETVNWFEALALANALSEAEGLTPCYTLSGCSKSPGEDMECSSASFKGLSCTGYRLPTEAEWEYAARAGTTTPFSTGRCLSTGEANYAGINPQEGCSKGEYRKTPVSVGSFAANAWGLFDMHGNVWEWVWDWKDSYSSGSATDPLGPSSGSFRVYRGGGWINLARVCRSADRGNLSPGIRYGSLGFRLARSVR